MNWFFTTIFFTAVLSVGYFVFILLGKFFGGIAEPLSKGFLDETGHRPNDMVYNSATRQFSIWKDVKQIAMNKEPIIAHVIVFDPFTPKTDNLLSTLYPGAELVTAAVHRKDDEYEYDGNFFEDEETNDVRENNKDWDYEDFFNDLIIDYAIRIYTPQFRLIGQLRGEDAKVVAERFDYITDTTIETLEIGKEIVLKVKISFE